MTKDGVFAIVNKHTGNYNKTYDATLSSIGIYNATEQVTIKLTTKVGILEIITYSAWDDNIATGFTAIEIVTTGTFDLVVRI